MRYYRVPFAIVNPFIRWRQYARMLFLKHRKNRCALERLFAQTPILWYRNADDLPTSEQLQDAVATRLCGTVFFSKWLKSSDKARCVEAIEAALSGYRVSAGTPILGYDAIHFERVLERQAILDRAPELIETAREFRRLATELSRQLAGKLGIEPTVFSQCGRMLPASFKREQRGNLGDDWSYCFHGFQCGFRHRQNGQDVDVEFGFRDEFGVLDAAFWLRFLQTTPRYFHLADWLTLGYADAKRMMDVLIDEGLLIEIEGRIYDASNEIGWTRRGCIVAPA